VQGGTQGEMAVGVTDGPSQASYVRAYLAAAVGAI
jgi:hypothetical protein